MHKFFVITDSSRPEDLGAQRRKSAAEWVVRFYSDVTVEEQAEVLILLSDRRNADGLKRVWLAALVNERLLERARPLRQAVLDRLGIC